MNKCLVCDEVIEDNFSSLFCDNCAICYKCFNKFESRNSKFIINSVKGLILYKYNDFFREILYRYKGCYDYALKDVFLSYKLSPLN